MKNITHNELHFTVITVLKFHEEILTLSFFSSDCHSLPLHI